MPVTDENERKLHPWLRVVKNGNGEVNAVRADGSTRVACSASDLDAGVQAAPIYAKLAQQEVATPRWTEVVQPSPVKLSRRPKLSDLRPPDDSYINVFIEFFPEQEGSSGAPTAEIERMRKLIEDAQATTFTYKFRSRSVNRRNFLCATIPVPMLDHLKCDPAIASYIRLIRSLSIVPKSRRSPEEKDDVQGHRQREKTWPRRRGADRHHRRWRIRLFTS